MQPPAQELDLELEVGARRRGDVAGARGAQALGHRVGRRPGAPVLHVVPDRAALPDVGGRAVGGQGEELLAREGLARIVDGPGDVLGVGVPHLAAVVDEGSIVAAGAGADGETGEGLLSRDARFPADLSPIAGGAQVDHGREVPGGGVEPFAEDLELLDLEGYGGGGSQAHEAQVSWRIDLHHRHRLRVVLHGEEGLPGAPGREAGLVEEQAVVDPHLEVAQEVVLEGRGRRGQEGVAREEAEAVDADDGPQVDGQQRAPDLVALALEGGARRLGGEQPLQDLRQDPPVDLHGRLGDDAAAVGHQTRGQVLSLVELDGQDRLGMVGMVQLDPAVRSDPESGDTRGEGRAELGLDGGHVLQPGNLPFPSDVAVPAEAQFLGAGGGQTRERGQGQADQDAGPHCLTPPRDCNWSVIRLVNRFMCPCRSSRSRSR